MPQDLAAAEKNIDIIVRDRLHENAARVGAYLLQELKALEALRKVKQVRGIGMVFGIEFHLPIAPLIALACYRRKLLVAFADTHNLFFSPPLMLTKKLAREGADLVKASCGLRR